MPQIAGLCRVFLLEKTKKMTSVWGNNTGETLSSHLAVTARWPGICADADHQPSLLHCQLSNLQYLPLPAYQAGPASLFGQDVSVRANGNGGWS